MAQGHTTKDLFATFSSDTDDVFRTKKKLMFDLSNSLPSHSISDFHILCMYCTLYRFVPCKSATC